MFYSIFAKFSKTNTLQLSNYINPGSQIPQVEARKRCSRDLFTSSGRATALIDRHTAILLTYTSRFHWKFSGNLQEHICERSIRCFGSPGHLSLGSDRLNVTVKRTVAGKLKLLEKHPWMAGVTFIKFPTSLFHRRICNNLLRRGGPNDRMTVENIGKRQRVCSQHFVDGRPTVRTTRTERCLMTSPDPGMEK